LPSMNMMAAPGMGISRNEVSVPRGMQCSLAVPELTRSIDIKLNTRLSLRGHLDPIASSH
jgi:hypothetical protein